MANPSRSTRAGWEPLVCHVCGKRILMNGPKATGAMFSYRERMPAVIVFEREKSWQPVRDDGQTVGMSRSTCGDCLREAHAVPMPRLMEPVDG